MTDDDERLALADALRTPLTSALLASGLLADRALGAMNDAQREAVLSIVEDLTRIRILVDRGLSTERLGRHAGPLERGEIAVSALVARALSVLREQATARGIELRAPPAGDERVVVDTLKLAWALATLIGNAIRYAQTIVEVEVDAEEEEVSLRVRDDGPGIPATIATALFTRDGSGLSLFLVREIIEAHGGRIALAGEPGGGTTFIMRLPRAGVGAPR